MSTDIKQKIHSQCRHIVAGRMDALLLALKDLSESAANETKSSAGDKFETTRAMLHIEQDRVRVQIAELTAQQAVLNAIDPDAATQRIGIGSLAIIDSSAYFISTALGKITLDGRQIICLSLQSPLGAKLKGLAAGESVTMNGRTLTIESVS